MQSGHPSAESGLGRAGGVSSSDEFRAYTFVDRVTMVQPGVRARGTYAIPAKLEDFHSSLVAEATGQLAAWCALPAVDFKMRPVAGIADRVELLAPVHPGDTLELAAEIESVDDDAIAYSGTASVRGSPVVRLHYCVGPMLPVEDFDDPKALREHYELLCGAGAKPGGFDGVPDLDLEDVNGEAAKSLRAKLRVPTDAAFFRDHFPRKPIFPGTLLMRSKLKLVALFAAEIPMPKSESDWRLQNITGMKLRAFIEPGEVLDLEAELIEAKEGNLTIAVGARRDRKLAAAAQAQLRSNSRQL